jgi:RNA polymerase sigma factor (sigma-70 family)
MARALRAPSAPAGHAFLDHDEAALERFRDGDPSTLARVYWEFVERVEQIIQRSLRSWRRQDGHTGDVEDLVQETFARAFSETARRSYDGRRDYGPYVSTIARHVLIDFLRSHRAESLLVPEQLDVSALPDQASPEIAPWSDPLTTAAVKAYLDRLPPELTSVHHQRYTLGSSQTLAAEALGITRQRLRTLEGKLRAGLARALKQAGIQIGGSDGG